MAIILAEYLKIQMSEKWKDYPRLTSRKRCYKLFLQKQDYGVSENQDKCMSNSWMAKKSHFLKKTFKKLCFTIFTQWKKFQICNLCASLVEGLLNCCRTEFIIAMKWQSWVDRLFKIKFPNPIHEAKRRATAIYSPKISLLALI